MYCDYDDGLAVRHACMAALIYQFWLEQSFIESHSIADER